MRLRRSRTRVRVATPLRAIDTVHDSSPLLARSRVFLRASRSHHRVLGDTSLLTPADLHLSDDVLQDPSFGVSSTKTTPCRKNRGVPIGLASQKDPSMKPTLTWLHKIRTQLENVGASSTSVGHVK